MIVCFVFPIVGQVQYSTVASSRMKPLQSKVDGQASYSLDRDIIEWGVFGQCDFLLVLQNPSCFLVDEASFCSSRPHIKCLEYIPLSEVSVMSLSR